MPEMPYFKLPYNYGNYILEEEIGCGAYGKVYKSKNKLGKTVALKLMSVNISNESWKRFINEVNILSSLTHPNIVNVWDAATEHGYYYIAMEFLEGIDLDKWSNNDHDINDTLEIMKQICKAIEYTHQHGVLHRDIKPSNIILIASTTPVLIDFGLARWITPESFTKRIGTPSHMAPELFGLYRKSWIKFFRKKLRNVELSDATVRSDVYAIGAAFYKLLTGKRPYAEATSISALIQMMQSPTALKRPRALNPDIPQELENICLKAMAFDKNKRYESPGVMAQAIENYLKKKTYGKYKNIWSKARARLILKSDFTDTICNGCNKPISKLDFDRLNAVRISKGYYCFGCLSNQTNFLRMFDRYIKLGTVLEGELETTYEAIRFILPKRRVLIKVLKRASKFDKMIQRIKRGINALNNLPATAPVVPVYEFNGPEDLFCVDIKYQSNLDSGNISTGLREEFKRNNRPISEYASCEIVDKGKWSIVDGKDEYEVMIKDSKSLQITYIPNPMFYCMQDFSRRNLEILISFSSFNAGEVAYILREVLRGLVELHKQEILHRAITPGNILIGEHGEVKITNFILAKPKDDALTRSGIGVGLIGYTPPEQVKDASTVDEKADIWAVGAVGYELLTGKKVFPATDWESYKRMLKESNPTRWLRKRFAHMPLFCDWLRKALEKDKQNRFQTSEEMLNELTAENMVKEIENASKFTRST